MKTALTREINGKTIIIGFSDPVIDPVETEKKILALKVLDESDESRKLKAKIKEIGERQRMGLQAMKESAQLQYAGHKPQSDAKKKEGQAQYTKAEILMAENKPLIQDFKNKKNQLVKENAVYFQPKQSEVFIEDAQYEKFMKKEIGEFGKLTLAGKVIPDYSGHFIYQKIENRWIILTLILGDKFPSGAILERDLTEEQKIEISEQAENDRIAELSGPEKEAEKQSMIAGIANQAAAMRSALEIQGDPDALIKSQDWYSEQLALIEEKYN